MYPYSQAERGRKQDLTLRSSGYKSPEDRKAAKGLRLTARPPGLGLYGVRIHVPRPLLPGSNRPTPRGRLAPRHRRGGANLVVMTDPRLVFSLVFLWVNAREKAFALVTAKSQGNRESSYYREPTCRIFCILNKSYAMKRFGDTSEETTGRKKSTWSIILCASDVVLMPHGRKIKLVQSVTNDPIMSTD
ncbi:hypothetical protein RF11_08683 [Thelohanellus kitauei]|uniref:Uncharacterized protein n=1 Tax=Thelohanellus kitauei TaxID=669202 RepID=A0A0C2J357_THEKT|nr:hypothetical protein RF11_08683 [Thelohanellus kitauei]